MRRKSIFKTICVLCCISALLILVNEAKADGDGFLGAPSIPITDGSEILVAGTGLAAVQPGDISIEIPEGDIIAQVLLYWSGRADGANPAALDTIQVNGMDVEGMRIGLDGPSLESLDSNAYRVDITEMSALNNWIQDGQVNVLSISGLDFTYQNDGAAVVVILDDGSATDLRILDGNDFGYLPFNDETIPVTNNFAPSAEDRTAYSWLIVTDVDTPRPAAVDVTVDGDTTRIPLDDDSAGDFLQVVELEIPIPAGVDQVVLQALSIADGIHQPASLAWCFVSWELAVPDTPEGCTYTIGYWKNHEEDWPIDEIILSIDPLILWDMNEAMEILNAPPKGNAYLILAHQYIGAKLNAANGTSVPVEVNGALVAAQNLLIEYWAEGDIPKKIDGEKNPDRELAVFLAGVLDGYNNGLLGPCHCD